MIGYSRGPAGSACMVCGADLWGVRRYVTAGSIAVCETCVETLTSALSEATHDGEIEVVRSPKVFGTEPHEAAASEVAVAFVRTFGSQYDELDDYLEDAPELGALLRQGAQRTSASAHFTARVDAVRFTRPDLAEVRFQILMNRNPVGAFEGTAVKREGRWRVTRATVSQLLSTIGVHIRAIRNPNDM